MSYTKTTWSRRIVQYPTRYTVTDLGGGQMIIEPDQGTVTQAGTAFTEDAMNNLETQYDEAVADLAAHNLDNTAHGMTAGVWPESALPGLANGKIWRGDATGRPAAVSFDPSGFVPSGIIVAWPGLLTNIPEGWLHCDGNNGTEDLRGKMLYGVNAGAEPGSTGGSLSKTTTGHKHTNPNTGSSGSHNHDINVSSTGSAHIHSLTGLVNVDIYTEYEGESYWVNALATQNDGTHGHPATSGYGGAHTHTQGNTGSNTDTITDIRPPFRTVAWIVKI